MVKISVISVTKQSIEVLLANITCTRNFTLGHFFLVQIWGREPVCIPECAMISFLIVDGDFG